TVSRSPRKGDTLARGTFRLGHRGVLLFEIARQRRHPLLQLLWYEPVHRHPVSDTRRRSMWGPRVRRASVHSNQPDRIHPTDPLTQRGRADTRNGERHGVQTPPWSHRRGPGRPADWYVDNSRCGGVVLIVGDV